MEQVFKLFRIFERRFSDRPVHEQREIIQDVVKRVIVSQTGISIHYFAGPPQDVTLENNPGEIERKLLGDSDSSKKTNPRAMAEHRPGVRPAFKGMGNASLKSNQ